MTKNSRQIMRSALGSRARGCASTPGLEASPSSAKRSALACSLLLTALTGLTIGCGEPTATIPNPLPPRGDDPGILPNDPVDLDGDGLYDGIAIDIDGDGKADGVDTDGDGIADQPLPDGPPLPGSKPDDVCPPDNPFCGESDDAGAPVGCGEEKFDLDPVGVNVMIAVDGSKSMNSYWYRVQEAIRDMILDNPKLNYGMHVFWGQPTDDFSEAVAAGFNFCGLNRNDVLEPMPGQQTKVLPFMGPQAPGQGNIFYDFTPVIDPLNYYLEHTTLLENPKSTNYLVFISDGNDNCFGTAFASKADKLLAYEKLGIELVKKHIRVLPIGFDAASAQLTALGKPRMTNFDAMDTLAKNGGTGLDKALAADKVEDLVTALTTVAQRVRPCRFSIPATLDPSQNLNPFELNFVLAGKLVDRDRNQADGWNFVNGNTSEVEFYGKSCEAIRFGKPLEARKGCSAEVCGTSATQVATKPRAVEWLLDRSLSMNDCSNTDTAGCIPTSLGGGGGLTYWGVMAKSIGKTVVATVNDEVEFGLRMFPSAGAAPGSCDIFEKAEVDPGPSTELTIIRSVLSNLPLGFTPLVDALERVANSPGRLAEAQVLGAVIVVSDGGDSESCGVAQADAVARAGAAASKLLALGVKTYVIRFGSVDAATAGDDEILDAIVDNGGTAIKDPNNPSAPRYYPAPDEAKLNMVLDGISQSLATCAFTLGELKDPYVDKTKVNLYLNGQVVPFDQTQGWGWADPAQVEIQMYGQACTDFKNNRTTSLVVEFGCDPIVIL
ncbi:MAG: VWA domain-containing protein [Myxococcales bacterium]